MNHSATRSRLFALFAVLLLALNGFGGPVSGRLPFGVTSAYAAPAGSGGTTNGVDDLWNTVTSTSVGNGLNNNGTSSLDTVVTKSKDVARTITSVLTIISFVSLLFWVAKLALSAGNPRNRTTALTGILFSGVALALFGGAWVVVSFFWNILTT